jgi:hypothetical protein
MLVCLTKSLANDADLAVPLFISDFLPLIGPP